MPPALPRAVLPASFACAALIAIAAAGVHVRGVHAELAQPLSLRSSPYVGSDQCKRCHPSNHDSWHRTFHRSMTQEAGEQTVLGAFDGSQLTYGGYTARMSRDAQGGFRMAFSSDDGRERWQARIARTVGSRRYQQYLRCEDDTCERLPVAWNIEEQRFMHMNGAFLTPDPQPERGATVARADYERHVARWNDNCIYCHNVAPRPGLDPLSGRFDTHVAELGIACEACHGPGGEHVARNFDPVRRFALHVRSEPDPTIVNPERLSAARSAEICGHCHGQRLSPEIDRVHQQGDRFLPGDALADYSKPLFRDTRLNGQSGVFAARFWPDGTARLTAYEYQGFLQSKCSEGGALTCTSCHSMHDGDPRGQLDPARPGDALCTSCHRELNDDTAKQQHSHHVATSPGARCVSCHMPRVVYGLVGAHRSHRIDVPDPARASEASHPDACTLCHADRSRSWAAAELASWSPDKAKAPEAGVRAQDSDALPEVTRLLLAGDPIERAVAAAALGQLDGGDASLPERARRTGLLLDVMRSDAYPAVRAIAWRSLRALLAAELGPRVPAAAAFTPTDSLAARAHSLAAIEAVIPARARRTPAPDLLALRRPDDGEPIFIGE